MLTTLHSGFFPGDSTINQVVDIYNTFAILLTKEKKSEHGCDISKAFDGV